MAEWKDVTDKDGKPITLESSKRGWKDVKNEVGGNVTVNPYTTFTIMDSKGIPHNISGKDEADAYRQAIASGITPSVSTSKERSRVAGEFGTPLVAKLAPENTRTVLETGDWSLVDAAKDAFTLPQRALAGAFGGDMGKTSEEYASEGKSMKSIATSPLIVPNVFAGLSTGGLSLPAQIATTGVVGVGSGLAFNDNYGGNDAALDIALSATPALGPLLKQLPINASLKTIKSQLSKVGITGAEADNIAGVIQRKGYKAAPALGKEMADKAVKEAAPDIAIVLSSDMNPNKIKEAIRTSAGGQRGNRAVDWGLKTRNSLSQVSNDLARVDEAIEALKSIDAQINAGTLTQEGYMRNVSELIYKYRDIPEFSQQLEDMLSNAAMKEAVQILQAAKKAGLNTSSYNRDDLLKSVKELNITPRDQLVAPPAIGKYGTAMRLADLQAPTTSPLTGLGIGDISLGALKKIGQKAFTQPSPLTSNLESKVFGAVPYVFGLPPQILREGD